jgi:hypothetical protein
MAIDSSKSSTKLLPSGQRIVAFSIILLLVGANVLQINRNITLRGEIHHATTQLRDLEKKVSSMERETGFVGVAVALSELGIQNYLDYRNRYKLLAFFSMNDCSSCLTDETLRWGELFQNYRIPVVAVSVSKDSADVLTYRRKYDPAFHVFHSGDTVLEKLRGSHTPLVLLLDQENKIILAQEAEVGNNAKRERFYYQVSQIISPAR